MRLGCCSREACAPCWFITTGVKMARAVAAEVSGGRLVSSISSGGTAMPAPARSPPITKSPAAACFSGEGCLPPPLPTPVLPPLLLPVLCCDMAGK